MDGLAQMARENGRINFTAARVANFQCGPGKTQDFLWDTQPGLALRATRNGAKAYVFQSRIQGSTVRLTIGSPVDWTIKRAKSEAARLQTLIDQGEDPRKVRADTVAAHQAERAAAKLKRQQIEVTGIAAWARYCEDRAPRWSELTARDNIAFAAPGGVKYKRGSGVTEAGPLHSLLNRPLANIDATAVHDWLEAEALVRPTRAALGFRLLRAFINWCTEQTAYSAIVQPECCKRKTVRQVVPGPKRKQGALQREQLAPWFQCVQKEPNVVASAYLQTLLLVGARRDEWLNLRWADIDFTWQHMRVRDKVEGERTLPLTPYVSLLLQSLPRMNKWVFSSPTAKTGRMQDPNKAHSRALRDSTLPHFTLHDLRRSFATLSEWVDVPVGVVAQIQGHKPSAIAEKHYRVRPIDLLRKYHTTVESWILQEAGLTIPA